MKLKDLKRKLNLFGGECDDYEVYIDGLDVNLMSLEAVYAGSCWNIVLSPDEDDDDIEKEIAEACEIINTLKTP